MAGTYYGVRDHLQAVASAQSETRVLHGGPVTTGLCDYLRIVIDPGDTAGRDGRPMTDTSRTKISNGSTPNGDGQRDSLTASAGLPASATAARSMRAIGRITDTDERRKAFARHMEQFPPLIGRL